jgi:hypothetical protein
MQPILIFKKEIIMLIVGKSFLTRNDKPVKIVMRTGIFDKGHDMFRPFLGDNGQRYDEAGKVDHFGFRQSMDDLVAPCAVQVDPATVVGTVVLSAVGALFKRFA